VYAGADEAAQDRASDEVLDELAIPTRVPGPRRRAGHFVGLAAGGIARGKPMSATTVRSPTCSRPACNRPLPAAFAPTITPDSNCRVPVGDPHIALDGSTASRAPGRRCLARSRVRTRAHRVRAEHLASFKCPARSTSRPSCRPAHPQAPQAIAARPLLSATQRRQDPASGDNWAAHRSGPKTS
jgi:hypothetical protein